MMQVEGVGLHTQSWGAPGERPAIVLLHDSVGCVELWRDFPARLAEAAGRRVVAYDRWGFGRSAERAGRLPVDFIHDEGARWVASEFSATRIPPMEQAGAKFNNRFGLVYLLSVYTHLRRDMVENNLRRTAAALRPGGTLVFTIHGQHSADTAERYNQYWLDKTRLLSGLATAGYYYERYPYYYDEYGLTWFTKEAVQELVRQTAPELKFVSHHPAALDEHQDVFVYSKA